MILDPLVASGETPPSKWVTLTNKLYEIQLLTEGDSGSNWTAIIDRLGTKPMQFEGDSFWRMHPPTGTRGDRRLPIRYTGGRGAFFWRVDPPRVEAVYRVNQNDRFATQITSHTPLDATASRGMSRVTVEPAPGGPIEIRSETTLLLRRHTSQFVHLRARAADDLWISEGAVAFATEPAAESPVVGPNFSLSFRVGLPEVRLALGAFLAALGFAATNVPGDLLPRDFWGVFLLRAEGFLLIALGAVLVFRRLTFRP
jgi:hypothetical protein